MTRRVPNHILKHKLRQLHDELGQPPTTTDWKDRTDHSINTVYRQLSPGDHSWTTVLETAGLDPRGGNQRPRTSAAEVRDDLQRVASKLGHFPNTEEYRDLGRHSCNTAYDKLTGDDEERSWETVERNATDGDGGDGE